MLPPRSRLAAAPVLALLALACQDRAGPLSPDGAPPRASIVAAVCDKEADSRAHALINLVFTVEKEREVMHERFNKGRQAAEKGHLADSWAIYAPLLAEISARANAAPAGSELRTIVNELASLILVCSRQPEVAAPLLELLNLPEEQRLVRDIAFTVVSPEKDLLLTTPKKHFALTAPRRFFDETGLLIVSRIRDDDEFEGAGLTEYPPRYNVTLIPYTAQANFNNVGDPSYGPEDVTDTGVSAEVAICPGPSHPHPTTGIQVLRRPEPFLSEPPAFLRPSTSATMYVTCKDGHESYLAAAPTRSDRLLAGIHRAGARVADLFLPRLAYAVDGGIGGSTRLYSDYVAARAVQPSGDPAPSVDRILFTVSTDAGVVTVTHLPLAPNPTELVTAIPQQATEFGYVDLSASATCSWHSSKPLDVAIAAVSTSTLGATVTRAPDYTGAAKVTAVCNGTAGSLQILPGVAEGA